MRNIKLFLALVGTICLAAHPSFAGEGVLDNIADGYKAAGLIWQPTIFTYANKLFFSLATIEMAWCGILLVLNSNDITNFVSEITRKIMAIGFFYALLIYGKDWVPIILSSFTKVGSSAAHIQGLSPSGIFDQGIELADSLLKFSEGKGVLEKISTGILSILAALIIMYSFSLIAAQFLLTLIESYIVVSAGAIFLGFGGARWTTDWVSKYFSYVVSVGFKLLILYLIIGVGQLQVGSWIAQLKEGINAELVLTILGASLIFKAIVWQIPAIAASMLYGMPSTSVASSVSSLATGAGLAFGAYGAAKTASAYAGSSAAGAVGGGMAAKAAWNHSTPSSSNLLASSMLKMAKAGGNLGSGIKDELSASINQNPKVNNSFGAKVAERIKNNAIMKEVK